MVHKIATDWRTANLSDKNSGLCAYAEKLSLEPADMTEQDIQNLKSIGLDDRAIHDATQVISYFNYINRIADALDVANEDFVHEWEKSSPTA
ncbi:MAG: peroxidase [Chloroflexota bacterium]